MIDVMLPPTDSCAVRSLANGLCCFWGAAMDHPGTCGAEVHICIQQDMNTNLPCVVVNYNSLLLGVKQSSE